MILRAQHAALVAAVGHHLCKDIYDLIDLYLQNDSDMHYLRRAWLTSSWCDNCDQRATVCVFRHLSTARYDVCIQAFEYDSHCLRYMHGAEERVYLHCIDRIPWSLPEMRNPSTAVSQIAVERDGRLLAFVQNQTPQQCLTAVRQTPLAIDHCQRQTDELCWLALKADANVFPLIRRPSWLMCFYAVFKNFYILKYILRPLRTNATTDSG